MDDEIVQEVRRARLKILEEVGFDMDRLVERLMREQQEHPERLVSFPPPWASQGVEGKETPQEGTSAGEEAPGMQQSAGGWTDDPEGLDHWLEETRRLRHLDRRENLP